MKILLSILLFAGYAGAQCKTYFGVSNGGDSIKDGLGNWPIEAQKWWLKDGAKKYKALCYTSDTEKVNFILRWGYGESSRTVYWPMTTGTSSGGILGNTKTSTPIPIEKTDRRFVFAVYPRPTDDSGKSEPIYIADKDNTWRTKPDKDAFEDALKFLVKQ